MAQIPQDVPSPINFADIAQAREWTINTVARRPWRGRFFEAFAIALGAHFSEPVRVGELGSGPGHLAEVILRACAVETYTALDLSPAMHALALSHLGKRASRVRFVLSDFRDLNWVRDLGEVDVLLTLQAAHEVRHNSRLPKLLDQMRGAIRPGGLLLFSDHYAEPGTLKNPDLYVTRDEQPKLLMQAGFGPVDLAHEEGGMTLYAATRP